MHFLSLQENNFYTILLKGTIFFNKYAVIFL